MNITQLIKIYILIVTIKLKNVCYHEHSSIRHVIENIDIIYIFLIKTIKSTRTLLINLLSITQLGKQNLTQLIKIYILIVTIGLKNVCHHEHSSIGHVT